MRALRLCYHNTGEREKNALGKDAHKKSIFRTTLDYVIRSDYASIDVAGKHRNYPRNDEDPGNVIGIQRTNTPPHHTIQRKKTLIPNKLG